MEPAQERFHVNEKKEGRKGTPLNGAPFYGDVFCIMAVRKANSGVCLLVEVFDGVKKIKTKKAVKALLASVK
eukprot:886254-Pelagomonas_calceolata.AAC.2